MDDIQRTLVCKIKYLLKKFPAVVLIGARQVGKSTLLKQVLPESKMFDLEMEQDFLLVENDPQVIFQDFEKPLIFDEAQLSKNLFKSLRVEIDKTNQNGQFLLSGSSSPELISNISESLAGRIAIVEVPPFSFSESNQTNLSKFYKNINNWDELKKLELINTNDHILQNCLYGGYPKVFLQKEDLDFCDYWFSNYYKTYIERDIRSLFPTLKIDSFKRFVKMLSLSSSQIINSSDFARSLDVSQPTVKKYLEIANGTFIWRNLASFEKGSVKTVVKMPKGHIRDSGLLCYLLNINSIDLLKNHPQFGRIWESFIIEQIIKSLDLEYPKFSINYYRTKAGAEIDLIIEGRFGLIPIEIKSGINTTGKQLLTIKKFINDNHCPLAVIINRSTEVKILSEKIIQIPVGSI